MSFITKIVTSPSVEPVDVSDIKEHLRIDHNEHNVMLANLIQASREYIETICGRALVQRTLSAFYKRWPASSSGFILPYPPLQSVAFVKYTDTDGDVTTVSSDEYEVISDREPGQIVLAYGETWPTATLHNIAYPIEIQFVCGYAATDDSPADYRANIPEGIKNAIKIDVERRYDRPHEKYAERLDRVIDILLASYRVWWV